MIKFPLPSEKRLPDQIEVVKMPVYHEKDDVCNRIVGSLVGLAIGDALGASVEFRPQAYLAANLVKSMEGGGTWGLGAGKWTDDTSTALCLASSLIVQNGFNAYDQLVRYKWWYRQGYLSSTGHCFDIGQATRQALQEFSLRQSTLKTHYRCRNEQEVDTLTWDSVERLRTFDVCCDAQDSAGNGAVMRLAPVPLFYFQSPDIAVELAGRSASLTHSNKKAIDACRYYAALIVAALQGQSKDQLLDQAFYTKQKTWFGEEPLHEDIQSIVRGSFKRKGGYEDGIRGKGYIVNALEAALWAFWSDEDSFEKGALAAINLGDDTDTTAAIHGQLTGAYYGYQKIPKNWIRKLYAHDLIVAMGEWLHFQGNQRVSDVSRSQRPTATNTSVTRPPPKQSKTNYHHSISLDSSRTNPTTTRFTSNDDFYLHFQGASYNEDDPYTTNAHTHRFYRPNLK